MYQGFFDDHLPSEINKITEQLFISGLAGAMNKEEIEKHGITAVVDLCEKQYYTPQPHLNYHYLPLIDGSGNEEWYMTLVIETVVNLINEGHKVLVHCFAGVSRSGTVCAASLSKKTGQHFYKSLEQVNAARGCVDPNGRIIHTARKILGEVK